MTFEEWINKYETKKIYLYRIGLKSASGSKNLYVASEPYFDGSNFYEPLVKSMPYFERSMQDFIYGVSNVSFGKLKLITAEAKIDNDLASYNFVGCDIEAKIGGDEIAYSEFKTILFGRCGEIKYDDQILQIPIEDKQSLLLRRMVPAGIYNDYVANVVHSVLNNIGIDDTQIDLDMLNSFDADCHYNVYITTDGNESVKTFFDRLLAPLLTWYGFSRDGLFQISVFKAPAGEPLCEFKDDIEMISFSEEVFKKHYWKIKVSYISDATTDPPTRTIISQQDATIQDIYPFAMESGVKESYLTSADDANETLSRWWNMLSVQRKVVRARFKIQPLKLNLHDVVSIKRQRFNIDDLFRVIAIREDYDKSEVELSLFR